VDGEPSLGAWLALGGLWAAVVLGFAAGVRARGRAPGQASVKPAAGELPDPDVARAQQASLAVASLPAVAAIVSGADWPAILWWAIFALPASVALASLGTPPVLRLLGRDEGSARAPGGPAAGSVASAIALTCVPVIAVVLALVGGDVRLAVAIALLVGYGVWRGAYAASVG
jgi:hypothetical protein